MTEPLEERVAVLQDRLDATAEALYQMAAALGFLHEPAEAAPVNPEQQEEERRRGLRP